MPAPTPDGDERVERGSFRDAHARARESILRGGALPDGVPPVAQRERLEALHAKLKQRPVMERVGVRFTRRGRANRVPKTFPHSLAGRVLRRLFGEEAPIRRRVLGAARDETTEGRGSEIHAVVGEESVRRVPSRDVRRNVGRDGDGVDRG